MTLPVTGAVLPAGTSAATCPRISVVAVTVVAVTVVAVTVHSLPKNDDVDVTR